MIHTLSSDHEWVKYPAFYNAYPLSNEVRAGCDIISRADSPYGDVYIDDYYGRIFNRHSHQFAPIYGQSSKMAHYVSIPSLEIVDELRVPYRRIPIFQAASLEIIESALAELQAANKGHKLLLRGQTKTYLLDRDAAESGYFYAEEKVKEPSFLPSHLRKNFDPYFLKCMWQSHAAMLLNDVGYDIPGADEDDYWRRMHRYRNSPLFILFALGIGQHYGLPSVGLDLTDQLNVACWFATHSIRTATSGEAKVSLVPFDSEHSPTIFFFKCPEDAVFEYKSIKPDRLPEGRPDRQGAWFGHVGWGAASNQLASYLMCGFRLTPNIASQMEDSFATKLFPAPDEDLMLKHFLRIKGFDKHEGEVKRVLQGIYFLA